MPTILIPAALRRHLPEPVAEFHTDAATVGAALTSLCEIHPELKPSLFEEDGSLRSFARVFVGEESIDTLDGLETELGPRDEILLLPPIAGG
jgi:molybdopterin converting factor small subunit